MKTLSKEYYPRVGLINEMGWEAQFNRRLDELFSRLKSELRSKLLEDAGLNGGRRARKLNRHVISQTVERLKETIVDSPPARKRIHREFRRRVRGHKTFSLARRHLHGRSRKVDAFLEWSHHVQLPASFVYVIRNGKTCVYVGRTGRGGSRPADHFTRYWFPRKGNIAVYIPRSGKKLASLECLAIHRFRPARNKDRAARIGRNERCPICRGVDRFGDRFTGAFKG